MKKCLIVIDPQNDLCEGGSMAVENSLNIILTINNIKNKFDYVIVTKRCYNNTSKIFKKNGGIYSEHCIEDTIGYNIHDGLINFQNYPCIKRNNSKSVYFNDYSINSMTTLKNILNKYDNINLYFCGFTLDEGIYHSIIDSYKLNYKCYVIIDICGIINKNNLSKYCEFLKCIGTNFIHSNDLI